MIQQLVHVVQCSPAPCDALASGPALTIEERIEERMAFKLSFYRVRDKAPDRL
jgi:hypothetical protein